MAKHNYKFTFTFDKALRGQKEYNGTLTQCVKQFNNDKRKHVIPAESVIKVEMVD